MEDIACCPVGGCRPVGLQCWSQAGRVVLGFPTVGQGRFQVTHFPCPGTGHVPLVGSFAGRWGPGSGREVLRHDEERGPWFPCPLAF